MMNKMKTHICYKAPSSSVCPSCMKQDSQGRIQSFFMWRLGSCCFILPCRVWPRCPDQPPAPKKLWFFLWLNILANQIQSDLDHVGMMNKMKSTSVMRRALLQSAFLARSKTAKAESKVFLCEGWGHVVLSCLVLSDHDVLTNHLPKKKLWFLLWLHILANQI